MTSFMRYLKETSAKVENIKVHRGAFSEHGHIDLEEAVNYKNVVKTDPNRFSISCMTQNGVNNIEFKTTFILICMLM